MSRFISYLFSPELYWALVCLLVQMQTRRNLPPTQSVTSYLDDHWAWLPFVITPLTFLCLLVPVESRWWLLLRIDVAIVVGLFVATYIFVNGMVYHQPSSGPGAGTAFIVIPSLGYFFAMVGTLITALVFWWQKHH
jgi:hypothetical protein